MCKIWGNIFFKAIMIEKCKIWGNLFVKRDPTQNKINSNFGQVELRDISFKNIFVGQVGFLKDKYFFGPVPQQILGNVIRIEKCKIWGYIIWI